MPEQVVAAPLTAGNGLADEGNALKELRSPDQLSHENRLTAVLGRLREEAVKKK